MKKSFVLLLALILILALSACTDSAAVGKADSLARTQTLPDPTAALTADAPSDASSAGKIEEGEQKTISRDRAIEIALKQAGLDITQVFDLEAEKDREKGTLVWEVDFDTKEWEYSYDIDAVTEAVVKTENEPNR